VPWYLDEAGEDKGDNEAGPGSRSNMGEATMARGGVVGMWEVASTSPFRL
jgi:hypothetical protein